MSNTKITLLRAGDLLVCDSTAATVGSLLEQLTGRESHFGLDDLNNLLSDSASRLFLLEYGSRIVGMLTLCTYLSPVGRKVWVEDVVVAEELRSKGLGRQLMQHAIAYVRENFAPCSLMLTSRPSRIAANELYRSQGFEPRQTNVYKMDF
ncbi:MAG: GNAT family N-acetyltransferase [Alistipes sp.]|nr:GNAT family N-acetyltransferase [Alistipes sp.]